MLSSNDVDDIHIFYLAYFSNAGVYYGSSRGHPLLQDNGCHWGLEYCDLQKAFVGQVLSEYTMQYHRSIIIV